MSGFQVVNGSKVISGEAIAEGYEAMQSLGYITETPLEYSDVLSSLLDAHVWLKREDIQLNRSFKCRGAAYGVLKSDNDLIVTASAGNHGQGVALACKELDKHATIFMPSHTPKTKIERTLELGGDAVTIELVGETFDVSYAAALQFQQQHQADFIHPFNTAETIIGQATVGVELYRQCPELQDIYVPVGGGGFLAGIASYYHHNGKAMNAVGVEPLGAPAMLAALAYGEPVILKEIDTTVDGAAIQQVGDLTTRLIQDYSCPVLGVTNEQLFYAVNLCHEAHGIRSELAGALSLAGLLHYASHHSVKGRHIACVISGANIDDTRWHYACEHAPEHYPDTPLCLFNPGDQAGRMRMRTQFSGLLEQQAA